MSNILVIEDDEQVRVVIRKMIEREGHNVLEAADGVEGVRIFRENRIDLTITDIPMPEKDGILTILELKKLSSSVKIIAISGAGNF
jgi:DNA-binding response OmpR family regulator